MGIRLPRTARTALTYLTALAAMVALATVTHAALLSDDFSDEDWETRWEIHDDGTDGNPATG